MVDKAIKFTDAQKSMIANTYVAPNNGTAQEAIEFVEYCEELGLNPLLHDVVFQKFETKNGPRHSFLTTRDGLLRIAARDKNYVGAPISSPVREGDHFKFIPSKGDVEHEFGQKRGRILGAYAVLYHKIYRPCAVWVDFDEYFNANAHSQNGRSYIWDSYPSAMIQKVAETFALKRQFPLIGGMSTEEEVGVDINIQDQMKDVPPEKKETVDKPAQDLSPVNEQESITVHQVTQSQEQPKTDPKKESAAATEIKPETQDNVPANDSASEPAKQEHKAEQTPEKEQEQTQPESAKTEQAKDQVKDDFVIVKVLDVKYGESATHIKYANIELQGPKGKFTALARGNALEAAQGLSQGTVVEMKIAEFNGWHMIQAIQEVVSNG